MYYNFRNLDDFAARVINVSLGLANIWQSARESNCVPGDAGFKSRPQLSPIYQSMIVDSPELEIDRIAESTGMDLIYWKKIKL